MNSLHVRKLLADDSPLSSAFQNWGYANDGNIYWEETTLIGQMGPTSWTIIRFWRIAGEPGLNNHVEKICSRNVPIMILRKALKEDVLIFQKPIISVGVEHKH